MLSVKPKAEADNKADNKAKSFGLEVLIFARHFNLVSLFGKCCLLHQELKAIFWKNDSYLFN